MTTLDHINYIFMRKIVLLLLLFPFTLAAQSDSITVIPPGGIQDSVPETSIILKDNDLIFQKVYMTALNKDDLASKLKLFLPGIKSFQLADATNQTAYQLRGRLSSYFINFRKSQNNNYGIAEFLFHPLNADVLIQIKDGKYRVTVFNMVVKDYYDRTDTVKYKFDLSIESFMAKDKRSKISTRGHDIKAAKFINSELINSFDINSKTRIKEDF